MVDSVRKHSNNEWFAGSQTLNAGLEMIDGPTVEITDIVSTALRKQADGIIFLVNADEPFDWWPVQQVCCSPSYRVSVHTSLDSHGSCFVLVTCSKRCFHVL